MSVRNAGPASRQISRSSSLAEWVTFQEGYESAHQGPTEQGRALAHASLHEVVRLVIPRGMQELTRQALLGTMDERVRNVLGLPTARLPVALTLNTLRLASVFGAGKRVPTMDGAERPFAS